MNFSNILNEIEKNDPEVYEKVSGRRHILKSFGAKVALASLPFAVGSMFKKAYGKTTDVVIDALNFALELEYFEFNFYHVANNTGNLIAVSDAPGFLTIEAHEKAHINFLINTITTLGGTPFQPNHYSDAVSVPPYIPNAYDFTAQSNTTYAPIFGGVFTDYPTFLIAASVFEDTGIRAYMGQMQTFLGNTILTQAQQIAATEGRHASFVRLIRRNMGAVEIPAPWITNNIPPLNSLQSFYLGEDNTTQLGISITSLPDTYSGTGVVPEDSATAAFDEPSDMTTVMSLIAPFILP